MPPSITEQGRRGQVLVAHDPLLAERVAQLQVGQTVEIELTVRATGVLGKSRKRKQQAGYDETGTFHSALPL
jgi:hypothetical protein